MAALAVRIYSSEVDNQDGFRGVQGSQLPAQCSQPVRALNLDVLTLRTDQ